MITRILPAIIFLLYGFAFSKAQDMVINPKLDLVTVKKIDDYITSEMKQVSYPGLSIAIVKGDETLLAKGYGYADLENNKPATANTLFEIGSNAKAFTGLAILLLEEKGLINLKDPITKYIPWFRMKYEHTEYGITIENLLYHTSGISYAAINLIDPMNTDDALEVTARNVMKQPLYCKPGALFMYSTVNYDILGFIIERISKMRFEDFITTQLLKPLKLNHTYLEREKLFTNENMAKGYKLGFGINSNYDAPTYRGNTPAGYVISNAYDMANWLKINTLSLTPQGFNSVMFAKSHQPDKKVAPISIFPYESPFNYSAGWLIFQDKDSLITHGGSNPNFASYLIINPKEKLGIAVLGNRNSSYPYGICKGVYSILKGENPTTIPMDIPYVSNKLIYVLSIVALVFIAISIYTMVRIRQKIKAGTRVHAKEKRIKAAIFPVIWLVLIGLSLYYLPIVLYYGFPWKLINVWGLFSLIPCLILIYTCSFLLFVNRYLKKTYPAIQNSTSN